MATMIDVTVNVDPKVLEEAANEVLQDEGLNIAIHNTLARYCHPYVPYLHGPLSETIEVTPNSVNYVQPYARRQYYGDNFNFTKDYHPLATSRWDEAMLRDRGDEFCTEVEDLVREFAGRHSGSSGKKPSIWRRLWNRLRRK